MMLEIILKDKTQAGTAFNGKTAVYRSNQGRYFTMSILNVENLSHGFGDRAIFQNVSFRLLKGEHIGLIGANGEESPHS